MGIQRYIFASIHNAEKHPELPLMQIKTCLREEIVEAGAYLCSLTEGMKLTDRGAMSSYPQHACMQRQQSVDMGIFRD